MLHILPYFIDGLGSAAAGYVLKLFIDRNKVSLTSGEFTRITSWLTSFASKSEVTIRREADLLQGELKKLL